jgi:hypothetical protein
MTVLPSAEGAVDRRTLLRLSYHLTDRTKQNSSVRWVQGWSVGRGSSRIRRESAPAGDSMLDA